MNVINMNECDLGGGTLYNEHPQLFEKVIKLIKLITLLFYNNLCKASIKTLSPVD